MMSRFTKGSLLATTMIAGMAFVSPAHAQDASSTDATTQETPVTSAPDADEGQGTEAIVVTGSRIVRRDLTSTSPLAVVQDEEFKLSGAVNVEQVINTLPQVVPGATSFSNNPGGGVATLNLRGLGSARTLVLVNGRRYVSFDTSQTVDLNTIPQFMIDSVDVVTGGASAVYGSDALAGVVNFRLKQDMEGIMVGGQYGITSRGDGRRYQVYGAIGSSFADGRGNVTAYAEYSKRRSVFQSGRDFSTFALGDDGDGLSPGGSATTDRGRFTVPGTAIIGDDPDGPDGPLEAPTAPRGAGNFNTDLGDGLGANFGTPGVSDLFDDPGDLFNYAPDNFLMVPQERYLAGAYGSYEISDAITAFTELTFVNNRVANELAPTPVTGTFNVNLAAVEDYLSPADFAALQQVDANETAINAARALAGLAPLFGPSAAAGTVQMGINRRITETGSRNTLDERNAFRVLAGVKGPAFGDFNYEAYYSYARTRNANIQAGNISRSAFKSQVESGAINVFGPNTLSPADVDSISILAQNGEVSVLQVAQASLTGSLGNLGMGADNIGIAVGAEYRKMSAQFIPDTALSSGDVIGFNAGDPTAGAYNVKELFGELRIPIIADRPFFYRLEVNGAARYSDYSLKDVGGVWTYAAGVEWAPVKDLTFRGQYQRAVRAPNVGELFGGQANGFPGITDPCSDRNEDNQTPELAALCIATGVAPSDVFGAIQANDQAEAVFGGNPDLQEETSDTYTVGAVIRPSFIPRLNIAIDYFNIKVENYISTLGGGLGGVLDLCYNVIKDANSIYCQTIAAGRNPDTSEIGTGDNKPLILNANVAKIETSGVDFQIDYSLPLNFGLFGPDSKLSFFTLATYTGHNKFFAVQELDDFTDCAGKFGLSVCGQPQPKLKWASRLTWLDGPLTSSVRWRHVGPVRDDDPGTEYVVERLKPYNVFDATLGFDVTENFNLTAGVNNLLDKKPQLIGDNQEQANTYPSVYDVLGRDFFISASLKF